MIKTKLQREGVMKRILTGRKYTDTGIDQHYDVVKESPITGSIGNAVRMDYIEPKTGYKDHVLFAHGIIYIPSLQAGHYQPTEFKIIEMDDSSAARTLRSIPSKKRSDASRANGAKGGRPRKTERTKMNTYTVSKEWGAEYSPSMSGHCTACGKPLNGRDTHIRHTVRAIDLNLDIKHNIEAGEIQICDRHKNLSSAVRKAFKAITGFDCGPLRNSL